jgi:hypothetical protein
MPDARVKLVVPTLTATPAEPDVPISDVGPCPGGTLLASTFRPRRTAPWSGSAIQPAWAATPALAQPRQRVGVAARVMRYALDGPFEELQFRPRPALSMASIPAA